MRAAVLMVVLVTTPLAAVATPSGPFLLVGGAFAHAKDSANGDGSTTTVGPLSGPHVQLGYEVGDRFNHQFGFVYSQVSGGASVSGNPTTGLATIATMALGYQLTYDFLGKDAGLTPYLGGGLWAGKANIHAAATSGNSTSVQNGSVTTLELHLVGGARYLLPNGVGFRAELAYSTYGGFLGTLIPQVGVTYRL